MITFIKQHKVFIVVLLLTIIVLAATAWFKPSRYPLSIVNGLRLSLILATALLWFFRDKPLQDLIKGATATLVPLTTAAIIVFFVVNPHRADFIALEDFIVEMASFGFAIAAAILMFIIAAILAARKQALAALTSLGLGLVFFVIGMEEVSWMQRMFNRDTPEFFLEHNAQWEINFHNMATDLSEQAYYFAAFILLTILPFYRHNLIQILNRFKLQSLTPLLPATWILPPFILVSAYVAHHNLTATSYSIATIFSAVILSRLLYQSYQSKQWPHLFCLATLAILFLSTVLLFTNLNYQDLVIRNWVASEYREMFIAWGLAVYSIDTYLQIRKTQSKTTSTHSEEA